MTKLTDAGHWWWINHRLHERGIPVLPKLIKHAMFYAFHAMLPPECALAGPVSLGHHGVNVGVNHTTHIGRNVYLASNVSLAKAFVDGATDQSGGRVIIEDDVFIGTGACVLANGHDVYIGKGAVVGAHAVVTKSVPAGATVVGNPARVLVKV
jgi:serine O-acetyltransferase